MTSKPVPDHWTREAIPHEVAHAALDELDYRKQNGRFPIEQVKDALAAALNVMRGRADSRVERVAEYLWVREMRHSDHPNSERAAKRWWRDANEPVRESWLKHAAAVLAVADLSGANDDSQETTT